jgi:hypothetical protein
MSFFAELIFDVLMTVLIWIILFPVVMILATPIILIVSIFGNNSRYADRAGNGYCAVFDFWSEYGLWCLPWDY